MLGILNRTHIVKVFKAHLHYSMFQNFTPCLINLQENEFPSVKLLWPQTPCPIRVLTVLVHSYPYTIPSVLM